jgi:phosphate transport system substrate-binding protein
MRYVILLITLLIPLCAPHEAWAQAINGSGSTFAYPVIAKWAEAYEQATGRRIAFQPIGSSAGVAELRADMVDFAVTDTPLVDAQLLRDGLMQFPLVIGAIVPVVNLDGITSGRLRLSGAVLADIYLGKIHRWSDPAIVALNPDLPLPDRAIVVVYRTDGSGTTFNWTTYLSHASVQWQARAGASTKVAWPVGAGARGNGGVAEVVGRVSGAIGYVEYSYAAHARLTWALAQNRAGFYLHPDPESFLATLAEADWAKNPDFSVVLADATGPDAYPLMATSFALVRAHPWDTVRREAMLAFFRWVLENGREQAAALDYLPLPAELARQVEASWGSEGR